MLPALRTRALAATAVAALAGAAAPALAASAQTAPRASARALLRSRQLWATIDVCSPSDQPNTVGIRGSMPGDRRAADRMFMGFRLQYMSASGTWVDLASEARSGFVAVGNAASAREDGRSFQLAPVPGKPPSDMRGVVTFQWRHGRTVLLTASRATSAGHRSVAGADPAGFSAASCAIG
jgi:hypothetical protein